MTTRVAPSPDMVRRHNELFDLYDNWPGDPDDDPEFVAQAREIMGLPPLTGEVQASAEDIPDESRSAEPDVLDLIVRTAANENLTQEDLDFLYEAMRAAGADVTPGHDQLHHYWTRDPRGRERWVHSPTPWRTLLALLVEHVKPPKPLTVLKKWVSRWYIEVFGYAAGSDKARVAHGKPPRGKRVGPG
ncbi:MAG: hypothetical protein ACM30G_02165 [Micromonosporaceae bacterium]